MMGSLRQSRNEDQYLVLVGNQATGFCLEAVEQALPVQEEPLQPVRPEAALLEPWVDGPVEVGNMVIPLGIMGLLNTDPFRVVEATGLVVEVM